MMTRSKNYQDSLLESLADANEAAAYLNAALEDGDNEVFLLALRNVADARVGGMSKLAEETGLNRESLYRMLSENGNPELNSLSRLLQALGLKLAVETDETAA
jgi:probable addiction module antidote protein